MLIVVVCSDGAGSACWARTKDHRAHASVPEGGDGRFGGQPLVRAPSSVVPAGVPSRGVAPPMLYSLWWRQCSLGQQGCVQAQRATLALPCRAVAKLTVNPLSFASFLEHARDLRVNILRRKRVRHPGTQVFVGKNLKKPLTHTHTHETTLVHSQKQAGPDLKDKHLNLLIIS
jgi:hypothetical protein